VEFLELFPYHIHYIMNQILLIGPCPNDQKDLITGLCEDFDFSLVLSQSDVSLECLAGCISFEDAEETRNHSYGWTTVVLGENIPLLQVLPHDNIPRSLKFLNECMVSFKSISYPVLFNFLKHCDMFNRVKSEKDELISEVLKYRRQKKQLVTVGTSLTSINNIDDLLTLIVDEAQELIVADAGSIYIREKDRPGGDFNNQLRFKVTKNKSIRITERVGEFVLPIDTNTIAGYVAHTGQALVIDDVYALDGSLPFKFGRSFDKTFGYHMKSMLTVPLKNIEGTVVGVLQLMNKKRSPQIQLVSQREVERQTVCFSYSDQELIESLASLAAVSIERVQLHESIYMLFEGFLESSIAAIDARDRVTSGHSRRVMEYALVFAEKINQATTGPFKDMLFSEPQKRQFKFAALLHDIGKIGIPESILTKEARLSSGLMHAIEERFDYIQLLLSDERSRKDAPAWHSTEELEADRQFVFSVNKAGFLSDEDLKRLNKIRYKSYRHIQHGVVPLLSDEEWQALSIRRGNLTDEERAMIRTHAISSYKILSKIPWGKDLEKIPDIAMHHHERVNGTGYPHKLTGDDISMESKILAIIDIFEALVAQDRPYKPALPAERAVEILKDEVRRGHLDKDLVLFFIDEGIFRIFL